MRSTLIPVTLLAFAGGCYYYTMHRVRSKDDVDIAIEKRGEGKNKGK